MRRIVLAFALLARVHPLTPPKTIRRLIALIYPN